MTPEQLQAQAEVLALFDRMSDTISGFGRLKARPIIGGVFGSGRFALASAAYVKNGLDDVMYFVIELESGSSIAGGHTKDEVMHVARQILTLCDRTQLAMYFGRRRALKEQAEAEKRREARELEEQVQSRRKQTQDKVKSISRRRRKIFDESGGKCHYCATPLTLDGKWHVEHKFPRALGGGDEPTNLVASCTPCNHEKRDTTDVEYKAKRAAKEAV
jgi:5-methylcytosine-specific restriction endonuclease McrA